MRRQDLRSIQSVIDGELIAYKDITTPVDDTLSDGAKEDRRFLDTISAKIGQIGRIAYDVASFGIKGKVCMRFRV